MQRYGFFPRCFDIGIRSSCNRLVFRESSLAERLAVARARSLGPWRLPRPRPINLEFSLDRPVTHFLRFLGNVSLQLGMQGRRSGRKEATRLRVALRVCRGKNSCGYVSEFANLHASGYYCGTFSFSKNFPRHQVGQDDSELQNHSTECLRVIALISGA